MKLKIIKSMLSVYIAICTAYIGAKGFYTSVMDIPINSNVATTENGAIEYTGKSQSGKLNISSGDLNIGDLNKEKTDLWNQREKETEGNLNLSLNDSDSAENMDSEEYDFQNEPSEEEEYSEDNGEDYDSSESYEEEVVDDSDAYYDDYDTEEETSYEDEDVYEEDSSEDYYEESSGLDSVPTLEDYLSSLYCGSCGRYCLLISPRCRRGADKASWAEEEYYAIYG